VWHNGGIGNVLGMHQIYLLAGGNLNNTAEKFERLFALLRERIGEITCQSSYYQSEPHGFESEHLFVNIALCLQTTLSPFELLQATQSIEKELGRTEKTITDYQDRTMDIDIIFYDNEIIQTDILQIPHPRMHEREFVLTPLNEIAEDFVHPVFGDRVGELHAKLLDLVSSDLLSF
jgi:2-amino-4-hydroxy-6-hydroxymethyldihydropteridine diphosphokinase